MSHFNVPRLAAPWEHEVSKKSAPPPSHTIREFNPSRQRRRLLTNSSSQFGLTLILCAALAATLTGYQTVLALTLAQKHTFNAIITLLSICLGMNLQSSLRSYAQMIRWRFLASKYRTLQEFELVMQCDSQLKVIRLFWTVRTRGRLWINKTQWLCMIWIGVNVAMQILVALLGFTYNLDGSNNVNQVFGTVSICNLTVIEDFIYAGTTTTFYEQIAAANEYGIIGGDYQLVVADTYDEELTQQTVWANPDLTVLTYRFIDQDPDDPDLNIVTQRTISSTAVCHELKVVEGGNGSNSITTYIDLSGQRQTIDMTEVSPGAITYSAKMHSDCGPRCTELRVLQSSDGADVLNPHFWTCTNNVSHVANAAAYVQPGTGQTEATYDMPDEQARMIAGAIGYSGFYYTGDDWQYIMYSQGTWWSPELDLTKPNELAKRVMDFAMGAVAAMDYGGPRSNVTNWEPVAAQLVDVQWRYVATILGLIPALQLLALLAIVAWANKAIIKDTSFLAAARLLSPVVDRLGRHRACLLTGDEIAEELQNVRVAYGYRDPPDMSAASEDDHTLLRHVDILEETEGLLVNNRFPRGRYDGFSPPTSDPRQRPRANRRRRRESI